MKYSESHKDKKLRTWFGADNSKGLLRRILLVKGIFRGLNALDISFEYPITAICGKNGSGKSTITAIACCGFHNITGGYKLPKRKNSYYTFSDFFIQHGSESAPGDVILQYSIAHNNWTKTASRPDGTGIGNQIRKKTKGGKWNDYDGRVNRTVVFLGIERVVPHSERSQSRSYSKAFKDRPLRGWEEKVMIAVGFILGKKYDDFRFVEHSKYSLPIVKQGGVIYSGFNMGAGENALFEIFSTLYSAGAGSLLVIDEMELGLHAEAQRKLVDRLKDVCLEERIQVICTTHSKEILDSLPLDARFYIESVNGKTRTTPGISSDFAFAKLSSITNQEADLLVEDEVAKAILLAALPAAIRTRIRIAVVGSAGALARQLAASYMRKDPKPVMAVFDGDQLTRAADNLSHAKKMAENATADFEPWFSNRVGYLPGEAWPEAWLLKKAEEIPSTLADVLNTDKDTLLEAIEYGKQAGKHKEFREIAHQLGLDTQNCLQLFVNSIISEFNDELSVIEIRLEQILNGDV